MGSTPKPGDVVEFEVGYDARDCSALATNICPTGERLRGAVARTTQWETRGFNNFS